MRNIGHGGLSLGERAGLYQRGGGLRLLNGLQAGELSARGDVQLGEDVHGPGPFLGRHRSPVRRRSSYCPATLPQLSTEKAAPGHRLTRSSSTNFVQISAVRRSHQRLVASKGEL